MKIFLLTQSVNNDYDTYDSCIIIAENKNDAKIISCEKLEYGDRIEKTDRYSSWVGKDKIDSINIEYIGEAKEGSEQEVVCSSFNAG